MSERSGKTGYNVALRYRDHVKGYAGVVTWTSFADKVEFDRWYAAQSEQEMVEEGVTAERCVELVKTTPPESYVKAAFHDATDKETGHVYRDLLRHELDKAAFAIAHSLT